jgi:phospholipid N-methyltransferase
MREKQAEIEAMKATLAAGVQVVSAPELFPTPPELARRMVEALGVKAGDRVLEPSAGTGALVGALSGLPFSYGPDGRGPRQGEIVAVEINADLCKVLRREFPLTEVINGDFLALNFGLCDRIIMNPPFSGQADIAHVTHALKFVRAGGKLVAVMSAGVLFRQDRKASEFRALIETLGGVFEELPEGSFKASGTNVNTVLLEVEF